MTKIIVACTIVKPCANGLRSRHGAQYIRRQTVMENLAVRGGRSFFVCQHSMATCTFENIDVIRITRASVDKIPRAWNDEVYFESVVIVNITWCQHSMAICALETPPSTQVLGRPWIRFLVLGMMTCTWKRVITVHKTYSGALSWRALTILVAVSAFQNTVVTWSTRASVKMIPCAWNDDDYFDINRL